MGDVLLNLKNFLILRFSINLNVRYSTFSKEIMLDTTKTGVRLLSAFVVLSCCGELRAQTRPPTLPGPKTPSTQSPSPTKTPSAAPSPNATPLPQSTPFAIPNAPGPSMTPAATPAAGSAAPTVSLGSRTPQ